jgi:hypothetical protein
VAEIRLEFWTMSRTRYSAGLTAHKTSPVQRSLMADKTSAPDSGIQPAARPPNAGRRPWQSLIASAIALASALLVLTVFGVGPMAARLSADESTAADPRLGFAPDAPSPAQPHRTPDPGAVERPGKCADATHHPQTALLSPGTWPGC